jgi:hypothetical protein
MNKRIAGLVIATSAMATSFVAGVAPASAAPADGQCVAQGAGATFDGPTKAAVAKGGLMSFVILDHAFNGADGTEDLLGITICS